MYGPIMLNHGLTVPALNIFSLPQDAERSIDMEEALIRRSLHREAAAAKAAKVQYASIPFVLAASPRLALVPIRRRKSSRDARKMIRQ